MKKKISIILSVILLLGCMPLNAFAENVFTWLVEPSLVYDNVYGFHDGLSGVRRGGDELRGTWADGTKSYYNNYHGVVNLKGEEIIPCADGNPKYGWGSGIANGYVWKYEDGRTIVYDSDGENVLNLPYDNVDYRSDLSDGLFRIDNDTNMLLIDIHGNIILEVDKTLDYFSVGSFGNSLIRVAQHSNDSSAHRYDIYDYYGNCLIYNADNMQYLYKGDYRAYGVEKNGKYALINDDAEELTDFEYDTMEMLEGGLIKVTQGDKIGLLDVDGRFVLSCEYDKIEKITTSNSMLNESEFAGRSYIISKDELSGIISMEGNIIVPAMYTNVYADGGIASCFDENNVMDCYNYSGNVVYSSPSGYRYQVRKHTDNCYSTPRGLVDADGNILFEKSIDTYLSRLVDETHVYVACTNQYSMRLDTYIYDIINHTVSELTNYYSYNPINNSGKIIVTDVYPDGRYGLIDINENVIVPCEYEDIYTITNNTFLGIVRDGKRGIMDYSGNIIVPCEFDSLDAKYSWGSYYKYFIEGKKGDATYYGYIDKDNKLAVPCEYDAVSKYDNGYQVQKDGKYGIIGLDGTMILPCVYESASFMQGNYIKIKKNDKYGVLDLNGEPFIAPVYDTIYNGGIDLFKVQQVDKYGILDAHGNDVIPIEYDDIFYEDSGGSGYTVYYKDCKWCIITKDTDGDDKEEYGLADENGKILLDCEYNNIKISNGIVIVQNKEGLWGWGKYEYKMPITISSEVNDGILEVSITNDEELTGTMIVAFYKDNSLVKMEQSDITHANGSINFEIPNADIDYYKVFVWDGVGTMQPLSHTAQDELNIEYVEPEPPSPPDDDKVNYYSATKLNIDGVIYDVIGAKNDALIQIRTMAEILDAEVSWNGETQEVTFTKGDENFSVKLNTNELSQNGYIYELTENLQIIGDYTYLPLDAMSYLGPAYEMEYEVGDDTIYWTWHN